MQDTRNPLLLSTAKSLKRREELSLYRKRKSKSGKRQLSKYVPAEFYGRIMSLLSDTSFLEKVLDYYSKVQPFPPIIKPGIREPRKSPEFFYAGDITPLAESTDKKRVYNDLRDSLLNRGVVYRTTITSPAGSLKKDILSSNSKRSLNNSPPYNKFRDSITPGIPSNTEENSPVFSSNEVSLSNSSELDSSANTSYYNDGLLNTVNSIKVKNNYLEKSILNIEASIANLTSLFLDNSNGTSVNRSSIVGGGDLEKASEKVNVTSVKGKSIENTDDRGERLQGDNFKKKFPGIRVSKNKNGDVIVRDGKTTANLSDLSLSALKGYRLHDALHPSGLAKVLSDKRLSIFFDEKITENIKRSGKRPSLRELGRLASSSGFGLGLTKRGTVWNVDNRRVKRILESFNINY